MIIASINDEREFVLQDKIVNKTRNLFKTPVNVIIHSLEYVNEGLEIGQYFFSDTINDGVLLYEIDSTPFSKPRELSQEEKKSIAQSYFDYWFNSGKALVKSVVFNFEQSEYNLAAFELHQAAERFYNTILLVFSNYKLKSHNLDILKQYCKNLSVELFLVFPVPIDDEEEAYLFNLLKRSYIEARYKNDFKINEKQERLLIERVSKMKDTDSSLYLPSASVSKFFALLESSLASFSCNFCSCR